MSTTHSNIGNVRFGLIMDVLWFCVACKVGMVTHSVPSSVLKILDSYMCLMQI